MRFGSYGNNNLCIGGERATCSSTESSSPAPFAQTYRFCSYLCLIQGADNLSQLCGYSCFCLPRIYGSHIGTTNVNIGDTRNQDRQWTFSLFRSNTTKIDSVGFTSPVSVAGGTVYGYQNTSLSNSQNYLGITCTVAYGYTFAAWRINSASGTSATTVATTNIFLSF